MEELNFKRLAINYLQNQYDLKYQQLIALYLAGKGNRQEQLLDSHRIFIKALQKIESYMRKMGYQYEVGVNNRGSFLQFTYDLYIIINGDIPSALQIIYATKSLEFSQDVVRIYCENDHTLSLKMIKKYQKWVIRD